MLSFQTARLTTPFATYCCDIYPGHDPEVGQSICQRAEWQAHHTRVTTNETFHWMEARVLNGICPGLVQGIATGDIAFDFSVTIGTHPDLTGFQMNGGAQCGRLEDRHRAVYMVQTTAESSEHVNCLCCMAWFTQDVAAKHNDCVGGYHQALLLRGQVVGSCQCFDGTQAGHQHLGCLVTTWSFIHIYTAYLEGQAQQCQQLAAAWRGRSQHQRRPKVGGKASFGQRYFPWRV